MRLTEKKVGLKTFLVTVALVALLVFGATHYIFASSTSITIEPASFVEMAEYVIFEEDGVFKAKNGTTGAVDISGTDPSSVISNALGNLTSGRTWKETVVLNGQFKLNKANILVPSYTIIDGMGSIVETDDIDEYTIDWAFFSNATNNVKEVEIKNLIFDDNDDYGDEEWAYFMAFDNVENFTVKNCIFQSPELQYEIDIDGDDIYFLNNRVYCGRAAIHIGDSTDSSKHALIKNNYFCHSVVIFKVSADISENEIYGKSSFILIDNSRFCNNYAYTPNYNTGWTYLQTSGDKIQISNNYFYSEDPNPIILTVGGGENILLEGNWIHGGHTAVDTNCFSNNVTMINNYVEYSRRAFTIYDICDDMNVFSNTIRNCTYGVYLVAGTKDVVIKYNTFMDNTNDIHWQDLSGTVIISDNDGFVTENSGTATITSSTSVQFNHGLAGTPTGVWASFDATGWTSWKWSATSTQITITVETSGTYEVYWHAEYKP